MSKIILRSSINKAIINPQGARIEELSLGGIKLLTIAQRADGKVGSSHPCTPNFDYLKTPFDLSPHGTMRTALCRVKGKEEHKLSLVHEVVGGKYPQGLEVTQTFALDPKSFSIETIHQNKGLESVPVNFAEHFYWVSTSGGEGVRINGVEMTEIIKNNEVISLKEESLIEIPGIEKRILLQQENLALARLWVCSNKSGVYDNDYVCIEPAEGDPRNGFFGSTLSLISPKNSRRTFLKISLTD